MLLCFSELETLYPFLYYCIYLKYFSFNVELLTYKGTILNNNNNDTSSYVTHNISNSTQSSNVTPTRKRSRRKTKPVNIQLDNSSVINLSSYSLSTDETSILARGLTFCPTPRHIDWSEVSADIYDFSRRMRLTEYFFDDNSNTSSANQDDTPFHN